jgi:hypothetical protein
MIIKAKLTKFLIKLINGSMEYVFSAYWVTFYVYGLFIQWFIRKASIIIANP